MLSIALAPALVICALLMTQPRTALIGMGTAVIGFTLLALQDSYNSDFMPFANSAVAVIIGLWIAAVVTRLVRSVGGAWSARRLRRINRRSLVAATVRHGPADGLELAALMLDRIGLLAPRLAALPPDDAEWTAELLSEVRVGINLVELQRIQSGLSVEQAGETDRLMSALGRHFGGDAVHPPAEVLVLVDACLALLAADEENAVRHDALLGFTDLRRSLFPKAAPYGFDAASALYAGVAA
jgi:uncharacterized membrane protein YccC